MAVYGSVCHPQNIIWIEARLYTVSCSLFFFSWREANHWNYFAGGFNDVFRICDRTIVDNLWYIVTMFGILVLTVGTVWRYKESIQYTLIEKGRQYNIKRKKIRHYTVNYGLSNTNSTYVCEWLQVLQKRR